MNEYELLRDEILKDYEGIRQYECILYTVVAAILSFAIGAKQYLLCLVPYIVIISIFHIVMGTKQGIAKIASYMIVFLEGDDYNWEIRHLVYDKDYIAKKNDFLKWGTHSQYYLLSTICSSLTIYMLISDNSYGFHYKLIVSSAVVALTSFICFIFYKNTFDYDKTKPVMIENWKQVKEKLDAQKGSSEISVNTVTDIKDIE